MPKTQSALLEAMAERQVTVDGVTRQLPIPFLVLATQNPIELEGTFPLPEAQLDRFLLKTALGYPGADEELRILDHQRHGHPLAALRAGAHRRRGEGPPRPGGGRLRRRPPRTLGRRSRPRDARDRGRLDRRFVRGSLALERAARAWALLNGRDYVVPEDVEPLFLPVLGHRIVFTPVLLAEARGGLAARRSSTSGLECLEPGRAPAPTKTRCSTTRPFAPPRRRGCPPARPTFPLVPRQPPGRPHSRLPAQRPARYRLRRRRIAPLPARRRRGHDRLGRLGEALVRPCPATTSSSRALRRGGTARRPRLRPPPAMALFATPLPWLLKPEAMRVAAASSSLGAPRARGASSATSTMRTASPSGGRRTATGVSWTSARSGSPPPTSRAPPDSLRARAPPLGDHRRPVPPGSFVFLLSDFLAAAARGAWPTRARAALGRRARRDPGSALGAELPRRDPPSCRSRAADRAPRRSSASRRPDAASGRASTRSGSPKAPSTRRFDSARPRSRRRRVHPPWTTNCSSVSWRGAISGGCSSEGAVDESRDHCRSGRRRRAPYCCSPPQSYCESPEASKRRRSVRTAAQGVVAARAAAASLRRHRSGSGRGRAPIPERIDPGR